MLATTALASAFRRTASRKRMVVLYWFSHTLCAAVAALPLLGVIIPQTAHSRYGAEMLRQFDLMYLAELINSARDAMAGVAVLPLLLAFFLALLGSIFLAGGAVKLLVREDARYSPAEFWEGCGRYFWRFLRLAIYSLFFYTIALSLSGAINKLAEKLWGEGMLEQPLVHAEWARQILLMVLCGFVSTAMDLAKVRLVTDDSRRSLRACFGSVKLALRHFGTVFCVWLGLGLAGALATWLYVTLANRVNAVTMGPILGLFVLQQVYVATRVWLRMMSWGAAASLDPVLRPPAPPEPAPETEPPLEPAFEPAPPAAAQEDFTI
jgi:hypothetical protein